jgi:hypothetical protein
MATGVTALKYGGHVQRWSHACRSRYNGAPLLSTKRK